MDRSEQRIPIEVDTERSYREPRRIGCSPLTLTALVAAAAFFFLFTQVTPKWVNSGAKVVGDLFNNASPTPAIMLGSPTPEITPTPEVTPTPEDAVNKASYVQVANTDGQGVRLRTDPKANAGKVRTLPESTVVQIIGPDETNEDGTWAHVRTVDENADVGWINRNYLVPAQAP